ncbi:DUF3810 domain-containing protein [Myroides sp. JBRI-B21084]|uniref:DUF3810 domain-containing protein n=1 Tax=Myroides sp. JBRI-B21084 TaxID=3119977 RepID=UPI0026E2DAA7|nr:DUF3810 domain-containing protein [Paenimyroides cloacae]WKW45734.1 DUF3810 domain-containing protein [Paenimyroides cloacae]
MNKKYFIISFTASLLILSYLYTNNYTSFFNDYYNKNIYVYLDKFLSFFSIVPFSVGDLLYAIVVLFILLKSYNLIKLKKYIKLFYVLSCCIITFLALFQLFWGFNNYKYSVANQLKLENNYSKSDLDSITNRLIYIVNKQQTAITKNTEKKVEIKLDLDNFNCVAKQNYTKLPENLKSILIENKINKVKPSLYSHVLSYAGFSGYFNPFTHENQVNIKIPTVGMPVTVAHEMAHQLGIASEAEANFFGYKNMLQSNELHFKYAANLYALKYCLKEYKIENEETYQLLFNQLNKGVQENILESELFWKNKRNVSSYVLKYMYGTFLKMNNQKEGIRSYNKFVDLLINYNKKYPKDASFY